jgi:MFS family permease
MQYPPRELIVITLAVSLTLLGDSLLYAVLPTIWHKIGLELWMVGALLSANRFIRFLTNPIAGRLVERYGLRKPFMVAVFLAAITTVAYGGLLVGITSRWISQCIGKLKLKKPGISPRVFFWLHPNWNPGCGPDRELSGGLYRVLIYGLDLWHFDISWGYNPRQRTYP